MENAILNLALNARDALISGGIIHISTSNVFVEHGRSSLYGFSPSEGMHVSITVSDTGIGMNEDVKIRLFEPFFTTKGDKGNGIGLFSVKETVQQMGGFVEIISAPKYGTQFVVCLPLSESECFLENNISTSKVRATAQCGNVLVIDDEEVVLEVFRGMLTYLGYNVTACSDPREAIALYRHCWKDYEIVLFDMSMPHMSGIECWNEIQHVNPQAKVIITSGYGMMADIEQIIQKGKARFLEKPFQIKHLEEIIEKIGVQ
jgi:CheY-like chemotaxis protein